MPDLPDWKTMPPAERDARIKKLARDGFSCSVIAGHFQNASRNAVIGRLHRIEAHEGSLKRNHASKHKVRPAPAGVVPAPKAKSEAERRQNDGRTDRAMVNRIQVKTETTPDRVLPSEKRGSFDPLPGVKPLAIIDLPPRLRCRWPIDVDQADLKFACGATTCSDTHVYCAPHRQMSLGRPTQGAS